MSTTENLPEDPADFDLLGWLDTGTIGRTTVVTYNDHEAWRRTEEILNRLTELGVGDEDPGEATPAFPKDAPMSDLDDDAEEIAALRAELDELQERRDASKLTWHVRAISDDEAKAARRKHERPKPPVDPGANASQQQREKFQNRVLAYSDQVDQYTDAVKIETTATAVEHVQTVHGQHPVTVDTLRALKARPHGQQWIDRLYQAANQALEQDVDVSRPTLPGRSTSTRG